MKTWLKNKLFAKEIAQLETLKKDNQELSTKYNYLETQLHSKDKENRFLEKELEEAKSNKPQEIYVNKSIIVNINDDKGLIMNNEEGVYLGEPKEYNFAIDMVNSKTHYMAGRMFKNFLKDLSTDESKHIAINIKDEFKDFADGQL